jgi:hypothetical protein
MALQFNETILFKTHQHPIIPIIATLKGICFFGIPIGIATYFLSSFSVLITTSVVLVCSVGIAIYDHYLYSQSWFYVGNQKISLFVRTGIWSQWSSNIRYRNIHDLACSKNTMPSYFFGYGTLFARASGGDGDFTAPYIPKVGKVYSIVNTLMRYTDDERDAISTVE